MEIKQITVIGAGTMGNGITQVLAMHNYKVTLCDISSAALDNALQTIHTNLMRMVNKGVISQENIPTILSNIHTDLVLKNAVAESDVVIEAATENVDIKLKIFKELDIYAPKHTILASNTSSISITKIASATLRPEKVIGMHFMNPVPIMTLVEIINGFNTDKEVSETIMRLTSSLGKTPVLVNDYPGFVANRILMPMINEAIYCVYEGEANVVDIDAVMKLGMAHPMGPLALADFIGLDVCLAILNILHTGFGQPKYAPCPLLVNMVVAGKLGKKTGEGFYIYDSSSKDMIVNPKIKLN